MLKLEWEPIAGSRPFHAALVPVRPRGSTSPHSHADFAEVFHVVEGSGVHAVGGEQFGVQRGDTVFVRPQDDHGFIGGPDGLVLINVAFPTGVIATFLNACLIDPVPWMKAATPPTAPGDGAEQAGIRAAFDRALLAYQGEPTGLDLVSLLAAAFEVLTKAENLLTADVGAPDWLRRAVRGLNAEQNLRDGVPRLLELAGVSHGHLAREVRRHFGCTPVQLVTEKRLELAATLLATSTEPVGYIAERCGFASPAYFIQRFRERYGVTPGVWRSSSSAAVLPPTASSAS